MRKKLSVVFTLILLMMVSCILFASAETESDPLSATDTVTEEQSEQIEVPGDAYRGDVDGDGQVTAVDARLILRHSASLEKIQDAYSPLADVDGDGLITASDARIALRMSANLESLFTYSESYHAHDFDVTVIKAASCTESGLEKHVCKICGLEFESEISAKGHIYKEATCTHPKTCTVCGDIEGSGLGHDFASATCSTPAICKRCGATSGSALGHQSDVNYKCVKCGTDLKPLFNAISEVTDLISHESKLWNSAFNDLNRKIYDDFLEQIPAILADYERICDICWQYYDELSGVRLYIKNNYDAVKRAYDRGGSNIVLTAYDIVDAVSFENEQKALAELKDIVMTVFGSVVV